MQASQQIICKSKMHLCRAEMALILHSSLHDANQNIISKGTVCCSCASRGVQI